MPVLWVLRDELAFPVTGYCQAGQIMNAAGLLLKTIHRAAEEV
jgi:aerobic-type carbon monoxide dehydrogenase small subunit (CoxS/CutS family)